MMTIIIITIIIGTVKPTARVTFDSANEIYDSVLNVYHEDDIPTKQTTII